MKETRPPFVSIVNMRKCECERENRHWKLIIGRKMELEETSSWWLFEPIDARLANMLCNSLVMLLLVPLLAVSSWSEDFL